MALVDYDIAWATKHRYDVLTGGAIARTQAVISECATMLGMTFRPIIAPRRSSRPVGVAG